MTSITIAPPFATIGKSTKVQLTATCNFSDSTTEDCTSLVNWTSSQSGIAHVSKTSPTKDLVTGVVMGSTAISGSLGGIHGSATVTVTAATLTSITITRRHPSIAKATAVLLTATGVFSDKSTEDLTNQVSWTSPDGAIAQVGNHPGTEGLVTGLGVADTSITAKLDGVEGSTTVTVTGAIFTAIAIAPPKPSIANGTTVRLTATGIFNDKTTEDLTSQVNWTSGDNGIAQVSDVPGMQGLVTGLAVGNTSITANLNGIQGTAALAVTDATLTAIVIAPPDPSVADGTTVQLTATGDFSAGTTEDLTDQVSWTSGDNGIAQLSDVPGTQGLVTALAVGNTSITATLHGIQGSTTVSVTAALLTSIAIKPPNLSIAMGTRGQLTATGTFSDGTTEDLTAQVFWTSSDGTIAFVGNGNKLGGQVRGRVVGSASIAATRDGVQGSTTVIVTPSIDFIVVTPPNPSLAKGTSLQLTATATLSDGATEDLTDSVSWSVDPASLATVNPAGLLTGVNLGSGEITASFKQGGKTFHIFTP